MTTVYLGLVLALIGLGGSWYNCELATVAAQQTVPALFVFGDSLVDVGNNNYLTLAVDKANFPHNGIDFPGQKATGRFSNGFNAADFLAQRLGLETPPPYLSLKNDNSNKSLTGVSFASAGAHVLDSNVPQFFQQNIQLNQQIDYYSAVYAQMVQALGNIEAPKRLSRSLFAVVIGSNDILGYFKANSSLSAKYTPQQYTDLLVGTLKVQLQYGRRKMLNVGLSPVGCCPLRRTNNVTQGCEEETNYWAVKYNEGLASLLQNMKAELKDFNYSFFNAYPLVQDFINRPSIYGFVEVKSACCGLGTLNAIVPCIPISLYCSNRRDHLFWDFYHPTEAAARIVVDTAFDGSTPYAYPVNVKQLIAV